MNIDFTGSMEEYDARKCSERRRFSSKRRGIQQGLGVSRQEIDFSLWQNTRPFSLQYIST